MSPAKVVHRLSALMVGFDGKGAADRALAMRLGRFGVHDNHRDREERDEDGCDAHVVLLF